MPEHEDYINLGPDIIPASVFVNGPNHFQNNKQRAISRGYRNWLRRLTQQPQAAEPLSTVKFAYSPRIINPDGNYPPALSALEIPYVLLLGITTKSVPILNESPFYLTTAVAGLIQLMQAMKQMRTGEIIWSPRQIRATDNGIVHRVNTFDKLGLTTVEFNPGTKNLEVSVHENPFSKQNMIFPTVSAGLAFELHQTAEKTANIMMGVSVESVRWKWGERNRQIEDRRDNVTDLLFGPLRSRILIATGDFDGCRQIQTTLAHQLGVDFLVPSFASAHS